jgi:microcystin-dependent protein
MASTYSTNLKIQLMGNGEDSGVWGSITNTNWNLIEQAVSGVQTITMANANYTLTNLNGVTDEARNMVLVVNGTNSAIYQIIAPLVNKFYVVSNQTTGGYAITIGGASGSIITVPSGTTVQVYCDGANFFSAQTSSAGNFNVNGNLTTGGNATVGGNVAIGGNLTVTGTTNIIPAGVIQMWPTASAPTGFLICNGASLSTSTYASLFSAIGYTFGGSGGTFLLPNYVDRMPIGAGTISALAGTGGSKDATLVSHSHTGTTSISDPGHSHVVTDPGHLHGIGYSTVGGGGGYGGFSPLTSSFNSGTSTTGISINSNTTGISASTSISTVGSSATNANLPPYLGINFIIKT